MNYLLLYTVFTAAQITSSLILYTVYLAIIKRANNRYQDLVTKMLNAQEKFKQEADIYRPTSYN